MRDAAQITERTIEIQARLAKSKADFFAGRGGLSKSDRSELEHELAELKVERFRMRDIARQNLPVIRRTQLTILAEKLAGMGLTHVYEESRREAIAAGSIDHQERTA